MTAEKKIAQHRLSLLQLAERLRNVSEACRRRGISRTQFYEYKRAFQERGFEGLVDQLPVPKSFPKETSPEIREKVIALSIQHPAWGPMRVSDHLRLEQVNVSPSTIRNILIKENMKTRYKRILLREETKNGKEMELTEEQIRLLEKANPCFRERHVESPYQIFLELTEIEHRRTKVATPRTNGFVERFNRTVLDELFREPFREKFYGTVEELQEDLDQWLHHYNYEHPHRGYRNMGRRPFDTIEAGKFIKEQMPLKEAA